MTYRVLSQWSRRPEAARFCLTFTHGIIQQHHYTPFHHIEKWNGNLFVHASLASPIKLPKPNPNAKVPAPANPKPKTRSAGIPAPPASTEEGVAAMVLQTCRESNGQPCPNIDPRKANETRKFTIADYNGFHIRQLQFCRCCHPEKDDKDYEQLLAMRLFPETFTHPQTVFTFTVMKQFHIHTLASKKSAYDYILPCLYSGKMHFGGSEILCIMRIFGRQRQQSRCHRSLLRIPFCLLFVVISHSQTVFGSSTQDRCLVCPEVGLNITAKEMQAALDIDGHKFTLFLSVDGNFKLQCKHKQDDPNDFALNRDLAHRWSHSVPHASGATGWLPVAHRKVSNDGKGYFVDTEDYKEYLRAVEPTDEVGCICGAHSTSDVTLAGNMYASMHRTHAEHRKIQDCCGQWGCCCTMCMAWLLFVSGHGGSLEGGSMSFNKEWIPECRADRMLPRFANVDYAVCFVSGHGGSLKGGSMSFNKEWIPECRADRTLPRFANVDYVVCFALAEAELQRQIRLMYDVWCHYSIKLQGRIADNFPSLLSIIKKVEGAIPKMHILNHIECCQLEWNLNWLVFCSLTRPKAVAKWELMNVNPRMESGKFYSVFQVNFKKGPPTHVAAYEKLLDAEMAAEKWLKAKQDTANELAERQKGAGATREADGEDVQNVTMDQEADSSPTMGDLRLITTALQLERDCQKQRAYQVPVCQRLFTDITALRTRQIQPRTRLLKAHVGSQSRQESISCAWSAYRRLLILCTQSNRVPDFSRHMSEVDPDKPEGTSLFLPSNFVAAKRATLKLGALAKVEYSLQEGLAYHTLMELHTVIRTFNYNKGLKMSFTHDEETEWEMEMERVKWFQDRALRDRAVEEVEMLKEEFGHTITTICGT
ncbi:hypothetical protein DFH08DRAFT_822151 [Mycena albidolilacea]|uniref:CxC2-like cysteine cluster KDZ transposase-associated domain-containing protein n=1 Tax=Mycena albidolilacea TaxID=1033008 RepID=A0AAD6Z9F1_9AGAR|nr:hypothetical protein DFH08DRAFT_822151 [Mycena albidolilacea]